MEQRMEKRTRRRGCESRDGFATALNVRELFSLLEKGMYLRRVERTREREENDTRISRGLEVREERIAREGAHSTLQRIHRLCDIHVALERRQDAKKISSGILEFAPCVAAATFFRRFSCHTRQERDNHT